jgi:CRP-like cAMP-binding protein
MMSPMPVEADAPAANNLLRVLRPEDFALIRPYLRQTAVRAGQVLYEPGDDVRHVYFPVERTLLAFLVVLDDGRAIETAMVGREGAMSGVVSQGRLPAYSRTVVLHGGTLLRMDVEQLEGAKFKSLSIRHLFARYADCLMAQVFQSVACNAAHSIEQRAAKWLCAALERTSDSHVALTQEQLADMLGVGRSYTSRMIQSLKARGLVATHRGGLTVLDPAGLNALSCGCQDSVRNHFEEVLKGVYPDEAIGAAELKSSSQPPARPRLTAAAPDR